MFIDKVTFIEYTKLPGIINDRFHYIFDEKKTGRIYQDQFVNHFVKVFLSDMDTKMKMTFKMYDFDNDGLVSREDARIMLSYMPFKRHNSSGFV
jgi:Ca2+-binding EF-hand superfamily protein